MQVRTERASLAEALAAASGELARYREATGRSLETLEAERSSAAALATRSKAQVQLQLSLLYLICGFSNQLQRWLKRASLRVCCQSLHLDHARSSWASEMVHTCELSPTCMDTEGIYA